MIGLFLVLASSAAWTGTPVSPSATTYAAPTMVIDRTVQEAGDVWRGSTAHYAFKVKNAGDARLEILAKPTCGCMVAKYDKVIEPGASGVIEADMKTSDFRGHVYKAIDVTSNDPAHPAITLIVGVNVKSSVNVLPSDTPVILLKNHGATTQEMQIQLTGDEPIEISKVAVSAGYVTSSLTKGSARDYKLSLVIGPQAPNGRSVFVVTVSTTSKREPQLNITAIVEKGILAMPPSVFIGTIQASTTLPVNQIVTIMRREGPFHLVKAESDDPGLKVRVATIKEGQQYQLTLTYSGGWPAGDARHKVVVTTDDPEQPRLEIPVMAVIRPDVVGTP